MTSGALEFRTALSLVSRRGELMGQYGEGEMEALPLEVEEARSLPRNTCAVSPPATCLIRLWLAAGPKTSTPLLPNSPAVPQKTVGQAQD
ncbi:MAG: hypothetical protein CM1200mP20_15730 [Pseudomonadota bacterium]|nr:MAG: hypothetical protein CM1200mP20_15730 [Pseudomonadota bacterium]